MMKNIADNPYGHNIDQLILVTSVYPLETQRAYVRDIIYQNGAQLVSYLTQIVKSKLRKISEFSLKLEDLAELQELTAGKKDDLIFKGPLSIRIGFLRKVQGERVDNDTRNALQDALRLKAGVDNHAYHDAPMSGIGVTTFIFVSIQEHGDITNWIRNKFTKVFRQGGPNNLKASINFTPEEDPPSNQEEGSYEVQSEDSDDSIPLSFLQEITEIHRQQIADLYNWVSEDGDEYSPVSATKIDQGGDNVRQIPLNLRGEERVFDNLRRNEDFLRNNFSTLNGDRVILQQASRLRLPMSRFGASWVDNKGLSTKECIEKVSPYVNMNHYLGNIRFNHPGG